MVKQEHTAYSDTDTAMRPAWCLGLMVKRYRTPYSDTDTEL
jgi:hypothetical protein